MAKAYDPKRIETDASLTSNYIVESATDRFFIPVNNDESGAGGTSGADAMTKQLAECQTVSPVGVGVVEGAALAQPAGYTYDTSNIIVQDATPTGSMANGDMWYNTTAGALMVYVDDGDSSQWVAV